VRRAPDAGALAGGGALAGARVGEDADRDGAIGVPMLLPATCEALAGTATAINATATVVNSHRDAGCEAARPREIGKLGMACPVVRRWMMRIISCGAS
jgi:hypothetical protein